jgi:hypothetical protein
VLAARARVPCKVVDRHGERHLAFERGELQAQALQVARDAAKVRGLLAGYVSH